MKTWLNKNFGFNKAEFNGFLVLIFLIISINFVPFLLDVFTKADVDEADVMSQIQKIDIVDKERYVYKDDRKTERFEEKKVGKLFYFDPNTIDLSTWQELGLSQKQAQAIVNYTSKGGKFYKPEDVKKMYTISPEIYNKIFPFIKIEPKVDISAKTTDRLGTSSSFSKKTAIVVELNSADSLQLQQIRGIGPAFARRIIAYRNRLGGFVKKDQLLEVYGLDSVKFEQIKDQVLIDKQLAKTTNLNVADFEAMKSVPYLSYKQMNAIIQYRKQHGNFNKIEDLGKISILDQKVIEKLQPYISF